MENCYIYWSTWEAARESGIWDMYRQDHLGLQIKWSKIQHKSTKKKDLRAVGKKTIIAGVQEKRLAQKTRMGKEMGIGQYWLGLWSNNSLQLGSDM